MKVTRIALALALAGISVGAHATNGYFSDGYGMKAKGMAGAATASSDTAFGGANNPASMAFAGNRIDLGVDLFSPIREANRDWGFATEHVESDSNIFAIPEFGYNKMINPNLALGVTVYGNGGMNTNYKANSFFGPGSNMLGGGGRLGVDLMQLIVAPTASYKINADHSIGISPLLGYQRFKAEGLQGFMPFSLNPSSLNNPGYDDAFGYGVRLGYMGKITPTVTIGAAYASKMNFEKLDKYKGLFAEQGDFDIAENYNLGVAWQATPEVKLALDYQRINFSGVNSVGNPTNNFFLAPLGANNGAGFGWDDVNVWKLGMEYKYNTAWTLRAGYSHANSPIKGSTCASGPFTPNCGEVSFNILAPAVIEDHVTLGFTYTRTNGDEITVAYMHGLENSVSGASLYNFFPGVPGPSVETIKMHQDSLGIQYSWK